MEEVSQETATKMADLTHELTEKIAHAVSGHGKTDMERAAVIAALCNILVLICIRMTGKQAAVNMVAFAISNAFKIVHKMLEDAGELN